MLGDWIASHNDGGRPSGLQDQSNRSPEKQNQECKLITPSADNTVVDA